MPGLAGRMSTVVKAKISRMLDRAEDPGETLDYGYQKQVELLQNVKKGIADVVTSKKRLQMQTQKLEQQVVKLDTQARQALAQGREDLARADVLGLHAHANLHRGPPGGVHRRPAVVGIGDAHPAAQLRT
jgi:phage shock protein A